MAIRDWNDENMELYDRRTDGCTFDELAPVYLTRCDFESYDMALDISISASLLALGFKTKVWAWYLCFIK